MKIMGTDFLNDEYIYFDWNAIQDLKQVVFNRKDFDPEAARKWKAFKAIQNKYKTPLSHAHFDDLMKSTNDVEIGKDLYFLANEFSDNSVLVYISELKEHKLIKFSSIKSGYGVFEFYQDLVGDSKGEQSNESELEFNVSFPSVRVDRNKLGSSSILNKYIDNDGVFSSSTFKKLLLDSWENYNDPDFMNEFNQSARDIKLFSTSLFDCFPEQQRELYKDMALGLSNFTKLSEKNIIEAKKFLEKYVKFIGKNVEILESHEGRKIAYNLLNFTNPRGAYGENFNKKNKPSNFHLDSIHYEFACKSKILVTGDKNFTKKSMGMNLLGFSNFEIKKLDELLLP